jgi:hypothetical protein
MNNGKWKTVITPRGSTYRTRVASELGEYGSEKLYDDHLDSSTPSTASTRY